MRQSLSENILRKLYLRDKKSAAEISGVFRCSQNKINYWIKRYGIPKRSISDAVYIKNNPDGNPFSEPKFRVHRESFLYGLGLGLYWGEGTKRNNLVRLGNTDPKLIKKFIEFLKEIYSIKPNRLKFGLQIFSDMNAQEALSYWAKELGASKTQFHKVIVTPARSLGTYREKTKHGVLTVHFYNTRLKIVLCNMIENIEKVY